MKILIVAPYVPSLIRVRSYQFLRMLSRQHEVSVLAVGHQAEAEPLREFCQSVDVVPMRLSDAARECALALAYGDPLQSAVCHSPALDRRFSDLLRQRSFDMVHVEHLRAARLVRLLPPSQPRLYDSVDSISLLLERTLRESHSWQQRGLALLELKRTRVFEGRTLALYDASIVTSEDDRRTLQQLDVSASARIAVVPNGVDLDYFRPSQAPRAASTLVFSGKMSYHANATAILHFVRSTLPLIRARHPDVRLLIVGSNPTRAVRELARDPAVTVTGHVADLRPYLQQASVAICPMVVKVGIQNKLLEAMAVGLPCVTSPAGLSGTGAVPDREVLVGQNPAHFAEQVSRVLTDPPLAAALGAAGRRYVENHHQWSAIAHKLETSYEDILERRHRAPA